MEEGKTVIVLATKEQESKDGGKFNVYFAYRQQLVDNEYTDVVTPYTKEDGTLDYKAKPIKVRLSQAFEEKLKETKLSFPLLMTLDESVRVKNEKGQYVSGHFITVDTDKKTKQPRLDKYGKRHLVLVIRDAQDIKEKPRATYSFDDLDDFE